MDENSVNLPPGPPPISGTPEPDRAHGVGTVPAQAVKPATAKPCPWNLTIRIVEGRTQLSAQNGDEVKFKINCDKLDVQTPGGRIDASGKVELASDYVEGTCDRLTISWQEDVVALEKAQLKCKLEGQAAELNAEQLSLRLHRVVATGQAEASIGISPFALMRR
jgi:hypothetical protein